MFSEKIERYKKEHGFEIFSPKAVLFDMDGVLYDSMPNHAVAWQEAMSKYGIRMTAADAYATEGQRGPDTIRAMVREQQGREIDETEAQLMYDEKARLFGLMKKAPVMEGIVELMRKMKRDGMRMGVVTGSGQRPLIRRLSEDFGEFVSQDCIVTAYDVKRGKPHPEPYLTGLRKAGDFNAWEGIVVENAPLGVRAGVAAGIFTIAVNTGSLPVGVLEHEGANLIFGKMTDLQGSWDELRSCFGE